MGFKNFKLSLKTIAKCFKKFIYKSSTHKNKKISNNADSSFRFAVMGDSRSYTSGVNEFVLSTLLQRIKKLPVQPAFILFGGDMVSGDHDVLEQLESWKKVISRYHPINKCYPAIGNHDDGENVFSRAFNYLPDEQLKGYMRSVYYFDYGNSRFVVLNANHKDDEGHYIIDAAQRTWLNKVLHEGRKANNFVMFHVPGYPIGHHYGHCLDGNPGERDALWRIIDKYGIASVFVGHEHNYNRRLIDSSFSSGKNTFRNRIYQLTLGGAGAPLEPESKDSRNVIVGPEGVYHYMVVDVAGKTVSFNVYDINNRKIDNFTV